MWYYNPKYHYNPGFCFDPEVHDEKWNYKSMLRRQLGKDNSGHRPRESWRPARSLGDNHQFLKSRNREEMKLLSVVWKPEISYTFKKSDACFCRSTPEQKAR